MTSRYEENLFQFINSRKNENSKECTALIIDFLTREMDNDNDGWVQFRDIKDSLVSTGKVKHESTLSRILIDLDRAHLIDREEKTEFFSRTAEGKKKKSVYYRITQKTSTPYFLSKDELIQEFQKSTVKNANCVFQLSMSIRLLEHIGVKEPNKKIDDLLKAWRKKEYKEYNEIIKEIKREIESNPVKYLVY